MFTCVIRYKLDLEKLAEFKEYGTVWMQLVEKYGGTHHGYFYPPTPTEKSAMPSSAFSFAGLGGDAAPDEGFAFFSFDSVEAYDAYREQVSTDKACTAITAKFNNSPCYINYERSFLTPDFPHMPEAHQS